MTAVREAGAGGARAPARGAHAPGFDVLRVREDFPILRETIRGKPLVYLDNAATAQKPWVVLDRMRHYYQTENSNVHRGVHTLSEKATRAYEDARFKAQRFLNAAETHEIVFTRGTTESVNLIAQSYGRKHVGPGDEVLITALEHHSNIVPWQILCSEKGARLRVAPISDRGEIILEEYEKLLGPRTRIVSVSHVSNALGTINPVERLIAAAHARGIPVLVDGAQAVPHLAVDVRALDCDFYAFSSHKLYGPTGVGVLYGKTALLDAMDPWQGGGDMISSVTFEKSEWNKLPWKFEAGTPNIAGAIGLGAALDWVSELGIERIAAHEHELLVKATRALSAIPGLRLIGTAERKAAVVSFVLDCAHPHDVGTVLDQEGIAIRTGHHCAQPVMARFGVPATARASFAAYNTPEEVEALARGLSKVCEVFG